MTINVDDSAVKRIKELRTLQGKENLMLRIRIEGGGCSGFQYKLKLSDDVPGSQDVLFADVLMVDDLSLNFLEGATVSFQESLAGSEFKIDNPNAVSGCGCGTSFAI